MSEGSFFSNNYITIETAQKNVLVFMEKADFVLHDKKHLILRKYELIIKIEYYRKEVPI